MNKKILLVNQGNSENLGDKAIKNALTEILKSNNCDVDFAGYSQIYNQDLSLMSSETNIMKEFLRKIVPPIFVWIKKYNFAIKKEVEKLSINNYNYDMVIIGGGQLIKTKCVFPYVLYTWYNMIRKNFNCPIVLLAIGADNKFTLIEKYFYNKVLPNVKSIYVRDQNSKYILHDIFKVNAEYIPDVVFSYSKYFPLIKSNVENTVAVMIYNYDTIKYNFGIQYKIDDYYKSWEKLLTNNINEKSIVYLAYTTIDDKIETLKFADYLKASTDIKFNVVYTDSLEEFNNLLNRVDKVITGRMHAMILGLNYGCKIVPYVVSSKIKTFIKEWLNDDKDLSVISSEIQNKVSTLLKNTRNSI